jgi:hypothetical protein
VSEKLAVFDATAGVDAFARSDAITLKVDEPGKGPVADTDPLAQL